MDISYFMGREVESVDTGAAASALDPEATWAINFDGGGSIIGYGEGDPPPVVSLAFTKSTEDLASGVASLYFGTGENPTGTLVVLRQDEYAMVDDVYSQGVVERPGDGAVSPAEAVSPIPAENIGGTPDGPSVALLAAQAAQEDEDADADSPS